MGRGQGEIVIVVNVILYSMIQWTNSQFAIVVVSSSMQKIRNSTFQTYGQLESICRRIKAHSTFSLSSPNKSRKKEKQPLKT